MDSIREIPLESHSRQASSSIHYGSEADTRGMWLKSWIEERRGWLIPLKAWNMASLGEQAFINTFFSGWKQRLRFKNLSLNSTVLFLWAISFFMWADGISLTSLAPCFSFQILRVHMHVQASSGCTKTLILQAHMIWAKGQQSHYRWSHWTRASPGKVRAPQNHIRTQPDAREKMVRQSVWDSIYFWVFFSVNWVGSPWRGF